MSANTQRRYQSSQWEYLLYEIYQKWGQKVVNSLAADYDVDLYVTGDVPAMICRAGKF